MIHLMNVKTCKDVLVPEDKIADISEGTVRSKERDYPYSDVHIVDTDAGYDYVIRVVESKKYIENLIKEKQDAKGK